jgi:hypothetical protein
MKERLSRGVAMPIELVFKSTSYCRGNEDLLISRKLFVAGTN